MRLHKIAILENRLKARFEMLAKLPLLLTHYGLENESNEMKWLSLAMKLAEDCVPGFKIEERKTAGRKKSWTDHELFMLYYQVRARIETTTTKARTKNIRDVCMALVRAEPWKSKGYKAKALQNKYAEAAKLKSIEIIEKIINGIADQKDSDLEKVLVRRSAIDALLAEEIESLK